MKYPYDGAVFKTENREGSKETLSIESHFVFERQESPMRVFDDIFSRFTAKIISSTNKAVFFNIPIKNFPALAEKTRIAHEVYFRPREVKTTSEASDINFNSAAFTRKFVAGDLKGKSPVDILLENEDGGAILNKQYAFLKGNLAKYPANAALMEAIKEAAALDISKVKACYSGGAGSSVMTLFDTGYRPLTRKQREDGKCLVYEGKVTWNTDSSIRYPVTVIIKNYYATVTKTGSGMLNVSASSRDTDSEIVKNFRLTADDWLYAIDWMKNAKDAFFYSNFMTAYKLAETAAREIRESSDNKEAV